MTNSTTPSLKTSIGLIAGFILSHNLQAADMAEIVKNVQAVCLSPSQQGKYWTATAKGGAKADGTIKLIVAGISGEATFTQSEWQGVQQALQPTENADYRDCVEKLTPLFVSKFAPSATTPKPATQPAAKASSAPAKPATSSTAAEKPAAKASAKPAKATAPAKPATPPPAAAPAPAANSDGDTNTQTIGNQAAEKIINATEINGNIDMGN